MTFFSLTGKKSITKFIMRATFINHINECYDDSKSEIREKYYNLSQNNFTINAWFSLPITEIYCTIGS